MLLELPRLDTSSLPDIIIIIIAIIIVIIIIILVFKTEIKGRGDPLR
jgi:hypothetical protein